MECMTVGELRRAIKECKTVWARIAFLSNEKYYRISKTDALDLVKGHPANRSAEEMDGAPSNLGILVDGELSLW